MKTKNSKIQILDKNELRAIKGGNLWLGVAVGYVVGEVVNGIMDGIDRANNGECC